MKGHRFPPLLPVERVLHQRVLVIAPHADDEVIGCGGTLKMGGARGCRIDVVHVTDGSLGDPEGRYGDIVAVRREEAVAALAALGLGPARELALADGHVVENLESLAAEFTRILEELDPTQVVAPSPHEAHPDHRAVAAAVRMALAGRQGRLDSVLFYGVNTPVPANLLVDITPVADTKDRAMGCYASQIVYNDIRAKVRSLDAARTVNVDLAGVELCEAFLSVPSPAVGGVYRIAAEQDELGFPGWP